METPWPVLTDDEREKLKQHGIREKITLSGAMVKGKGIIVSTTDGVVQTRLGQVSGKRNRVFAERSKCELYDSTIVAEDGCSISGCGNTIFASDSIIKGSSHVEIHAKKCRIYVNECKKIYATDCEIFGNYNEVVGTNNADKGKKNKLSAPPPPPPPPRQMNVADEERLQVLAAIRDYDAANAVPQREVHIVAEDIDEKDLEDGHGLPDEEVCLQCYARKRNTKFYPCEHVIICNSCAQTYRKASQATRKCPVCNNQFIAIMARNQKEILS